MENYPVIRNRESEKAWTFRMVIVAGLTGAAVAFFDDFGALMVACLIIGVVSVALGRLFSRIDL